MAIQSFVGQGPFLPAIPNYTFGNTGSMINRTSTVIDATGEKIALIGRHFNKDRATKDITKVGIVFGAVTKAGGSALTLSLQDVSLTAGPPFQPDETPDQTVAIANAAITANTFLMSGALSANRTVAFGDLLAVVIEFDGAGRLGADSIAISRATAGAGPRELLQSGLSFKTASWARVAALPLVIFEYTDGTFGTFSDCWPCSDHASVAIDAGSTPDEYGLEFALPFACTVDGAWATFFNTANAEVDVVLYDGTTAMTNGTVSADLNAMATSGTNYHVHVVDYAPIALDANHTYRLMVKPTTANTLHCPSFDVSVAGHMQAVPMGASFVSASRTDAGAFTTLATRRPFMGIRLAGVEVAAGGGSGLLVHPGMSGGMNG
jgi:hypothetical protein